MSIGIDISSDVIFSYDSENERGDGIYGSLGIIPRKNEDFIIKNPFEKRDFSNVNFVSKIILDSLNFEKKKFKNCQIWHISQNEPKYVKKFAKVLWKKHRARGRLIFKKNSKRFFTHISDISSLWKL